tara:strand:+ start:3296 stop:4846 length:1551 start_codon:yes stop_codon:yes gene_type:complete
LYRSYELIFSQLKLTVMKNLLRKHLLNFGLIIFILISSCKSKKGIIYSDNRYTPIPKVETYHYKSPQLRQNQNKEKAIGLAISGGGSRAQYFGLGVLIGLDDIEVNENSFLNEVDYFSTVSGGGFGTGYYMSLLHNNVLDNYNSLFDFWKSNDRKKVLQEFLFKDAKPLSILKLKKYEKNRIRTPYPDLIDYELLQFGKTYNGKKIERLFLHHFFIPKSSNKNVKLPMFVTNGTIYNNGERLPFMPHIIDSIGISGSLLPIEDFEIDNGYGLPLNYAITGSAAFPGVLPMLKMRLKNKPDRVVRIIDGGAVDNLGFTTLFELLDSDDLESKNKSMLIVDCGGLGTEMREQNTDRVKLPALLTKTLLYSVDIKLLYSNSDIEILSSYYDINRSNVKRIGISTIKEKYLNLEENIDESTRKVMNKLKNDIIDGEMDWEDLHRDLANSPSFRDYNEHNLSELPMERFSEFSTKDIFEIFELSSQVITKIKIYPWEKEILILAGRYVVYLEKNDITHLAK